MNNGLQQKKKLIRITTVPSALAYPLHGQPTYMNNNGFDVIMISAGGKETAILQQQENCPHIIVPMTRKITPFRDLWALIILTKIFLQQRPDIVHTETPKAGLLGMLAARLCWVKCRIHTVAGLPLMVEKGFKLKLLSFIEKLTYAAANHVWPNSPSLKEYILQHRLCPAKKIHIIGEGSSNGVDINRFNKENINEAELNELKNSINYDQQFTYLLFVGRMVFDKGIVELVNVFQKLYKKNKSLRLILAGPFERSLDPLPAHIEQAISGHPAIIHISWTDKVEHLMAIADYFVFPSHREGFPNVLLESAVMKLPVICSNIPGNMDIVVHGKTGLVFTCSDEKSLQHELNRALENKHGGLQMSEQLYQFVYNTFPREKFWKAMLQEYNKLAR